MPQDQENLRADLDNRLGIDAPMLKFILDNGTNNAVVRDYIERRIKAGNTSAKTQKDIMQATGQWEDR